MTELPKEQVDLQPGADGFMLLPSPPNAKLRFSFGYLKSLTPCNSAGNGIRGPDQGTALLRGGETPSGSELRRGKVLPFCNVTAAV